LLAALAQVPRAPGFVELPSLRAANMSGINVEPSSPLPR
jgi:hypothetical protein